ncbi:uncharacterized protein LOC111885194 [Lactuca sativa]|uniref:uncharacterized protein LOC111885194 n=1 Tax=Lactuca sativa TaxID=4236 RepID=UPI0022AE6F76|nr:uncharacterized protein LOC111885194 [Lactuca sativa]
MSFLTSYAQKVEKRKKVEEMDNSEELDNNVLEEHPIFNPQVHWKKQVPNLVMSLRIQNNLRACYVIMLLRMAINYGSKKQQRAKQYVMDIIEGALIDHYAKLWSYREEIRRSNPGSTMSMDVLTMPDGTDHFKGCTKVIGIDECFLKGYATCELLCVMGRDARDQIYPIAWAVVCVENKENWKWFLLLLSDDLNLGLGQGLNLMSDQYKFACNATTEQSFKEIMKDIELMSPEASNYLIEKDPRTWSRAYCQVGRCCSSVENRRCESFNAVIVEDSKKPIITMLEELRMYMMNKLFTAKLNGWSSDVSPEIRLRLNELKVNQRFWEVLPSGLNQFETRSRSKAYDVDLDKRTYLCMMWQLNGYGCVHYVAAISYLNRDVEKYMDPYFCREMYIKTYQY